MTCRAAAPISHRSHPVHKTRGPLRRRISRRMVGEVMPRVWEMVISRPSRSILWPRYRFGLHGGDAMGLRAGHPTLTVSSLSSPPRAHRRPEIPIASAHKCKINGMETAHTPHWRHSGPPDPPRAYPGDERRKLPSVPKPKSPKLKSPKTVRSAGLGPARLGTRQLSGAHTRQGAAKNENWSISLRRVGPFCSGIDTQPQRQPR